MLEKLYDFDMFMIQDTNEKDEVSIECRGYDCYTSSCGQYKQDLAMCIKTLIVGCKWIQQWWYWDEGLACTCSKLEIEDLHCCTFLIRRIGIPISSCWFLSEISPSCQQKIFWQWLLVKGIWSSYLVLSVVSKPRKCSIPD